MKTRDYGKFAKMKVKGTLDEMLIENKSEIEMLQKEYGSGAAEKYIDKMKYHAGSPTTKEVGVQIYNLLEFPVDMGNLRANGLSADIVAEHAMDTWTKDREFYEVKIGHGRYHKIVKEAFDRESGVYSVDLEQYSGVFPLDMRIDVLLVPKEARKIVVGKVKNVK